MAKCINKNTAEFKRVSEALKSPILANAAINNWQQMNNSDEIPTVQQVNELVKNMNTQYNLNKKAFSDSLLANLSKQGIITKFKNEFYIVQSRNWKYDPAIKEYNLKRLKGYLNANNIPLSAINTFIKGKGTVVQVQSDLFTPQDIIPASRSFNTSHTRKVINHLKQMFPGINIEVTTEEKAKQYYDSLPEEQKSKVKFDEINSFYVNGTAVLIQGRVKDDTAIEEVLHPFIDSLYLSNNELFTGLLEESKKNFPELWQGIQDSYADKKGFTEKHRELELVTQALSRHFNKEYTENPTKSFMSRLAEFMDWFAGVIDNLYQYLTQKKLLKDGKSFETAMKESGTVVRPKIEGLPSNATLSDIAKLLNTSDIEFQDITTKAINDKVKYNLSPKKEKVYKHVEGQANAIQKALLYKFFLSARSNIKKVESLSLSTDTEAPLVVLDEATHTYTDLNDITKTYKSTTEAIKGKMSLEKQKEYDFNMQLGNDFDAILDGLAGNVSKKDVIKDMQILKGKEFEDAYQAMKLELDLLTQDNAIAIPQVVVYDKATKMAGTIDLLIITKEGHVRVVDLKTSKRSIKEKNLRGKVKYESNEWDLSDGSILKENGVSKLSTEAQHNLQVLTYARMLQNMGYTLASDNPLSTIHLKVNVSGKGTKQEYKGSFVSEGSVQHESTENPYIDLLVPLNVDTQQAKKIKEETSNKPDSFYDAKNSLTPEEQLPEGSKTDPHYEVITQALMNYQAGLVKKQKALDQIKSSVFVGKHGSLMKSKEQVLSAISAVSIALTLSPKERTAVFSSLLVDALKQVKEFEQYVQDPANFGKPEYISYVLNFDRFLSTFEGLYLLQDVEGVNSTQQKLINQLQIKANLIAGTGKPGNNNYKEGIIDKAIFDYVRNIVKTKSNREFTEDMLDDLMREADDIGLLDLQAMDRSTSSDTLLALMDKIYKAKKQELLDRIDGRAALIQNAAQQLVELDSETDAQKLYDFMLEFSSDGKFTGRYVQELGAKYYKIMDELRAPLFDENGSPLQYREINDLSTARDEDIKYNKELAKKKQAYSNFWRAETVGSSGQPIAGEYHYYTQEFKDARAEHMYFIDNGYNGKWIRKNNISDKKFNAFQAKYYDVANRDTFIMAKTDQDGNYTGGTITGLTNPSVKREYRKARLDTSKGENMRSEKFKAMYEDRSALGLARVRFYEMFKQQFEEELLTKLPRDKRDQMLGRVPVIRGKVAQDLRGKNILSNKLFAKMGRGVKNLFTTTQTQKTLFTDEQGNLVDTLPIFYTGRPLDEEQLKVIDDKISMLKQKRKDGKILEPAYQKEIALLKGERSKIENKPTTEELNKDMGNGLLMFASMAQHYETMGTVEDTMKAMLKVIESRTYQKKNSSITGIKNKFGFVEKGEIKGVESNLYRKAKKFMSMIYYDNETITKSFFDKAAEGLIKYSSLSYVAFNPFGNFNNYVLGRVMDNIEALGGRYYSKEAFMRASLEFNKRALPDVMKRVAHGDYIPSNKADYNPQLPNSKYEAMVDIFRMMDDKADIRESGSDIAVVQKSYFSRFLDMGYVMQDAAEYNVQTKVGMALVMDTYIRNNDTGEIKSLYDAFTFDNKTNGVTLQEGFTTIVEVDKNNTDENGNLQAIRERGEYNDDFRYDLRNKIREVNKVIHGNYAAEDRTVMEGHALGKLAMQFHKWVIPGINARFRSEYFDENIGWTEGRYLAFAKFFVHAGRELAKGNMKFNNYSESFLERYGYEEGGNREQNQKALDKLHGYYRTLGELAFTMLSFAAATIMQAAFSGGDDDDELIKKFQNILMYQADRTGRELLVFMPGLGTNEQYQFIKSPIASTRTLGELGQAMFKTIQLPVGLITEGGFSDEFYANSKYVYQRTFRKGQLKVKKEWMDAVPILYSVKKWENYLTMKNFFIK